MRQKVLDYLKKPTDKARKQLTTMEQNWCDAQSKGKGKGTEENGEKAKAKKPTK